MSSSRTKVCEGPKGRNLSFAEMATLVEENWRHLSPAEREPYKQQAAIAREAYNTQLAKYKQTSRYLEYSEYLVAFKSRQSNQQGTSQGI